MFIKWMSAGLLALGAGAFAVPVAALAQARADIEIADSGRFFAGSGAVGSVTVYDPAADTWYYTDRGDADVATLPASTFKIVNSLILLQEGVVRDAEEVIPWDGTARTLGGKPYAPWNRSHTLDSAFKVSAVWVYEELSARVSRDVYRQRLAQIGYGNGALDEAGVLFWLAGDFGVTPRQQIGMLRKLHAGQLPFAAEHQSAVKDMMATAAPETGNVRHVAAKTGLATQNGEDIGWWCGWLELEEPAAGADTDAAGSRTGADGSRTLFFATRLRREAGEFDPQFAALRQQVTYRVIEALTLAPVKDAAPSAGGAAETEDHSVEIEGAAAQIVAE